MTLRCLVVVAAAVLGASTACSPRVDGANTVIVRDSAGVSIVESAAPRWTQEEGWRVGEVTAAFNTEVVGVVGGMRLANGAVVIGEEAGSRLVYFLPDGSTVSVGRSGDGPGEFRLLQAMGRAAGDTVWAYDYSSGRVTRFTASGELVDVTTLDPPLPSALAVGSLPDGSLVLSSQWRTNAARPVEGLVRDTVAVVRYVRGLLADTVGRAAGREFVQYAEAGGRMVMSTAILPRRTSAAIWGDAVVVGDQVDHELRVVEPGGVVRRLVRWRGPALALGDADVQAWIASRIATAHPDQRDALRALLAAAPVPDTRPAYDRLLADDTGFLWVSERSLDDGDPERWDVFDPSGAWLGVVTMPERFRPLDIGTDQVLGVARDAMDVERIEVRALLRSP